MKIALIDCDGMKHPNLALMKISAWHKLNGDLVEFFEPLFSHPDRIYMSKVFTFTHYDESYLPIDCEIIKGGTGFDVSTKLPAEIGNMQPDYTLYKIDYSLGFLSRGCPNKCKWCIVPQKEGVWRETQKIENIAKHKTVVLMDNNFLADKNFALRQLATASQLGIRLDFNQGLDARLIDADIARAMSLCKWVKIRMACDSLPQMKYIKNAVELLRLHKCTPKTYFIYVLINDIDDALKRVEFLRDLGCDPFAQPYRDFENNIAPSNELRRFARWVNHKAIFNTVKWQDYK
jgi:hypothetical protein